MGMTRSRIAPLALLFSALVLAAPATAADRREPDLFREGSRRFSVFVGAGTAFGDNYTIVGAGLGYFVLDGLEAGLEYESWLGGEKGIQRISPQLTYVFALPGTVKPYAGVFYRRTLIEQYEDTNDAGARAGALFLYGRRAYLGIGIVAEQHLSCDRTVYASCSDTYPEFVVAVIF
jgi:hypothetical protein